MNMQKTIVLIGTTSEQKISPLKRFLIKNIDTEIISYDVSSNITDQPLDERTTISGSVNRARNAIISYGKGDYSFSVGMEGGLVDVDGLYHLLCVVSIINPKGAVYTGLSKKLPLPITVSDNVKNGAQFGVEIRKYEKDIIMNGTDEQKKLVASIINRETSFSEALSDVFRIN